MGESVYIGGVTQSSDFPLVLGYSDVTNSSGRPDGFIAQLSSDLSTLYSSTSIGTEYFDLADSSGGGTGPAPASTPDPAPGPAPDPTPDPGTNLPPITDAGPDQISKPKEDVVLDARASSDPDGTITQYSWRQISGESVTLQNANQAVAKFKAPRVRRGQTKTLVFELVVTDNQGATAADQVSVSVAR